MKHFGEDKFYNLTLLVLEQFTYRNPIYRSSICRKTGFSPCQIHKVFNTLEEFGLITHLEGRNKRKKEFTLTPEGRKVARMFVKFKHTLRDVINAKKRENP